MTSHFLSLNRVIKLQETPEYFVGHFPDAPILPAAVQLDLVCALIREGVPGAAISGIERARFRVKLSPEDPIEIQVDLDSDTGLAGFRIVRLDDRTVASTGVLHVTPS